MCYPAGAQFPNLIQENARPIHITHKNTQHSMGTSWSALQTNIWKFYISGMLAGVSNNINTSAQYCWQCWYPVIEELLINVLQRDNLMSTRRPLWKWLVEYVQVNIFYRLFSQWLYVNLYVINHVWITHTHPFNSLFPGLPRWAGTRKVEPI